MKLALTFLATVAISAAADWTVNNPEVVSKELLVSGNSVRAEVTVRFFDDAPTPNEQDITFRGAGSNLMQDVQRRSYDAQQTLNGLDAVALGNFTPTGPTPVDQAVEDALLARRKMAALQDLKTVFGLAANAQLGTSGITVSQAEGSLEADVFANVTTPARLDILLENIPVAVE